MSKTNKKLSRVVAASLAALAISGSALAVNQPLGAPSQGAMGAGQFADKRPVINENSIAFGAYDPHGDFSDDANVSIEHLFLPWEDVDLSTLALADEYALERERSLMITVEPWSWSVDWRVTPDELLAGILAGSYDANIEAVCAATADLKSPVTMRWGQEMDETDGQFSWAQWTPEGFIAAYRRFVTECRKQLPDATYMWSPKGNPTLVDFYPGDEFVDTVGLSVFGYQPFDLGFFGAQRTFADALEQGYRLVEGYGMPIVVAELGYEGDRSYVRDWARSVAKPHPEFPELTSVVYFNDREVYPWPQNYGRPNWRVGGQSTASDQSNR
ncbi:MAG: beta-mannosidase [Mesorhizobium sp.]|nr:beta-mannosidase [Mesorhizobium sp.]